VPIVRARNESEAIRIANDREDGLSAAVYTKEFARGLRIARRIESGIGRFGGCHGIDALSQLRWISIETQHPHYPF
jgi:acyl-CoA reductase-like NAD-dependent aldehyde dehydrogenase